MLSTSGAKGKITPTKQKISESEVQVQSLDYSSSIEITSGTRGAENKVVLKMYCQPGQEQEAADAAVKLLFRTRRKLRKAEAEFQSNGDDS